MSMQWWIERPLWFSLLLLGVLLAVGLMSLWQGPWGLIVSMLPLVPLVVWAAARLHRVDEYLRFYRTLFEQSEDAIFVIQNSEIIRPNRATTRMTGYSMDELQGMDYSRFVAPSDRLHIRRNHLQRIEGDLPASDHYPMRLQRKDGSTMWVQLRVSRILWKGQPAVVCMLTDIDEAHRLEEKARDVRRLDAMMEISRELAREIRLWLTLMKEESARMLEAEDEDRRLFAWRQMKELFGTVQNTLVMLERMASLDTFQPEPLDLEELISTTCVQRVHQRAGATVQLLFHTRKTRVFVDRSQVTLIFQFILDELLGMPGQEAQIQISLDERALDEETAAAFQLLQIPYLVLRFSLSRESKEAGEAEEARRQWLFSTVQALALRNGGLLDESREEGQRYFELYLPPSRNVDLPTPDAVQSS